MESAFVEIVGEHVSYHRNVVMLKFAAHQDLLPSCM